MSHMEKFLLHFRQYYVPFMDVAFNYFFYERILRRRMLYFLYNCLQTEWIYE